MRVIVAESAGFCFGVRRAVSLCEKAAGERSNCVTLGPIIHNEHVTRGLEEKGVRRVSCVQEVKAGDTVIIRSHGAGAGEMDALEKTGADIIDATCPDVAKIHKIVCEEEAKGRLPVIIGDRNHPEVTAISDRCGEKVIFASDAELSEWLKNDENVEKPVSIVFQTTTSENIYNSIVEKLRKECTNYKVFDTICKATRKRQQEAAELSKLADAVVVIGSKSSANSLNLVSICKEHCRRVQFVDSAEELDSFGVPEPGIIGVTAGASTPARIIKEVTRKMNDELRFGEEPGVENEPQENVSESAEITDVPETDNTAAEPEAAAAEQESRSENAAEQDSAGAEADASGSSESFEEMLEKSIKTLHTGQKVSGTVTSITATEVSVDLGTKQSGYIPVSEFTYEQNSKIEDVVKIGDTIESFVMRVNDVEGMVMLSKKRLDAVKNWDDIEQARENKTVVEGVVVEENKGGIVVNIKGVRVFVPASQVGLPKSAPLSELIKKTVKIRITEVNQPRRRVVGSIRAAQSEERKERADKLWEEIEAGKRYSGVVKSMTSYGVFVDIGGVDGMIHISELSWRRLKHPSEVMNEGDEVSVYVLSFDKENRKISLGYKNSEDNPWSLFAAKHSVGDVVNVKIVKMMPFGAFAEICPGVDGLIHISQITDHRIGLPSEVLSDGQTVDVKITEIDNTRKKISLSIRALLDPSSQPLTQSDIEQAAEDDNRPVVVYDTDSPPAAAAAEDVRDGAADEAPEI